MGTKKGFTSPLIGLVVPYLCFNGTTYDSLVASFMIGGGTQ